MRRPTWPAAAVLVCAILTGCMYRHPAEPSTSIRPHTVSADLRSVVDAPPYWCDIVPKEALSRIIGLDQGVFKEQRSGWKSDHGNCLVGSGGPTSQLGLSWGAKHGMRTVNRMEGIYEQQFAPVRLPAELGHGFTAVTSDASGERPYYVIAAFRCGPIQPWLRIDLLNISPGRDAAKDLTALMRIAEQRFRKLHDCAPGST